MDKKQIDRAVAVLLNNATFGCVSKYDDGTSTPNRLMQLECAEYLHLLILERRNAELQAKLDELQRQEPVAVVAGTMIWINGVQGKRFQFVGSSEWPEFGTLLYTRRQA